MRSGRVVSTEVHPDLGAVGRDDGTPEGRGQQLPAETDAQHGHIGFKSLAQEVDLVAHPGADPVVVVHRPGRPHRHDRVEVPRIGELHRDTRGVEPIAGHHLHLDDVVATVGEHLSNRTVRGHVVLLDEQHLHDHLPSDRMMPSRVFG